MKKQYKVIQKWPGSPPIGTILTYAGNKFQDTNNWEFVENPKDFPKFLERVVTFEPDQLVLTKKNFLCMIERIQGDRVLLRAYDTVGYLKENSFYRPLDSIKPFNFQKNEI